MPITGEIPLPETGMSAFLDSLQKGADIRKTMAQANLPFGGANVPGPAGQIVGLEMVKRLYGEDSPQYKQASDAYKLNQQGVQSRIDYQNILSGTAPKRFSTNLGKTAQEYEDVKNGFLPGTRIPLTDEQKKYYAGKYSLAMVKPTTDADTRRRNLFSHNIDITLSKINPKSLTQYSGLVGGLKLLNENKNAQMGNPSEEYKSYQQSITAANTLAKQVRQFYGDSITPEVQNRIKELTNPSSWLKSPEIALQNYNAFVDLLKAESGTYREATKSADIYSENASQPPSEAPIQEQNVPNEAQNSPNGQQVNPSMPQEQQFNTPSKGAISLANKMELPSFGSKEEFQNWFKRQPKMTQDAVMIKLKGGR